MIVKRKRAVLGLAAVLVASAALVVVLVARPRRSSDSRPTEGAPPAETDTSAPLLGPPAETPTIVGDRRAAAAPATGAKLLLVVLEENGTPVPQADVIVFGEDELLARGETDTRGELPLDALDETPRAIIRPRERAPALLELPAAEGRCEGRLPRGETLAGILVVDGAAPREPVTLTLTGDHPLLDYQDLPRDVRELLLANWERGTSLDGATRPDGGFAFAGLPDGRPWSIDLPDDLRAERVGPEGRIRAGDARFDRARTDLVIEARTLPLLIGRYVDRISREPIAGVSATVRLWSAGSTVDLGVAPSDEDGRFRKALTVATRDEVEAEPTKGELYVEPPPSHDPRELVFEPPRGSRTVDLGEIELEPAGVGEYETHVIVEGARAVPAPGAHLSFAADPAARIVRTDETGAAVLRGREDWREVVIDALGFVTRHVDRPEDLAASTPWTVVLERGQLVNVQVEAAAESPSFRGLIVEFTSPAQLFDEDVSWERARRVGAAALGSVSRRSGGSRAEFRVDEHGRASVDALNAGIPIHVALRDSLGVEIHRVPEFVLAPEEWRELRHYVDSTLACFDGRVVDEQGIPIVGASVLINSPGGQGGFSESDEAGRFRFENVSATTFDANVRKWGYVHWFGQGISMPPEGPFEFRLERGRSVRVHVIDEDGRPVEASVTASSPSAGEIRAAREDDGIARLDDLASGPLTITAALGGRRYERAHSADEPECEIRVPNHGHVRARLPEGLTADAEPTLYVVLEPHDPDLPRRETWVAPGSQGELDLGPVLPGAYEAVLEEAVGNASGQRERRALGPRRPIAVEAHAETLVDL
jgi:hypothetical protein